MKEMKQKFILLGVLLPVIFALHSCSTGSDETKKNEYNIILLTVDTLRADHLHTYGYTYQTSPHIDAFADQSLFFEYAYCPIPKTSASFASMMTGLHPFIHKTRPNRGYLKEKYLTLAEILKLKGYYNYAVVDNANLARKFLFHQGFDEYIEVWDHIEEKEQSTPFITQKILSFLNDYNQERPFFLWVNYIEPHTPYVPPAEFVEERPKGRDIGQVKPKIIAAMRRIIKQKDIYDEGHYIGLYDGAVKYVDSEIGKVIDLFFEKGLQQNTIFIITADHGEDLGERNFYFNHGPLTFSAASRVPLIVYIPGLKSRRVKTPVSIMDICPTLLNRLDLKAPYPLQGVDLLRPMKNRALHMIGQVGSYGVVENNLHYVKVFPRLAKALGIEETHLYEIYADPYEHTNIFSQYKPQATDLNKKYQRYYKTHGYLKKGQQQEEKPLSEKEKKSLKTLGYL